MPIVIDVGWAPQPVWKFWKRYEALALMECSTLDSDEQNPYVFKKRFGFVITAPAAFFASLFHSNCKNSHFSVLLVVL
jgi:hypothetical protein